MKKVFFFIWCFTMSSLWIQAQVERVYSSGTLYRHPESGVVINSPYVSYSQNGQQSWMVVGLGTQEGRFRAVSSSMTGVIAAGYIKGSISLLDKRIVTPQSYETAIATSISHERQLNWLYAHETGLAASKFYSVIKLRSGGALISGYEKRNSQSESAILLHISKGGELIWKKKVADSKGLKLIRAGRHDYIWQIENVSEDRHTQQYYLLNLLTNQKTFLFSEENVELEEDYYNNQSDFLITSTGDLITARLKQNKLQLTKYNGINLKDKIIRTYRFAGSGQVLFKGIVESQREKGRFLLAFNTIGSIVLDNKVSADAAGSENILLVSVDAAGNISGHEQFGTSVASAGRLKETGGRIALAGHHVGDLLIGRRLIKDASDQQDVLGFYVFLDNLENADAFNETLSDSIQIETLKPLVMFPNPVSDGKVTIETSGTDQLQYSKFHLYSEEGKLVKVAGAQNTEGRFVIYTDNLAIGVYQVIHFINNKPISAGKLIISQ
ncbi:MAG: T9SS type A sorting domain-containing protein [Bacteroidota bacterium]